MKVLIVEDERALSESIATYLKAESYLCEEASNLKIALEKVGNFEYDCILLDITLPDGNGLNVLKALRNVNKTDGVIIISAKNSIEDKIDGLNLGADDFLAKPFHLSELSARISAVIRRRRFDGSTTIVVNDFVIDTLAKTVYVNNVALDITRKEFDLLLYLVVNKNRVISKSAIAEHITGDRADYFDNFDFVYAHIKNLKKKIAAAGADDSIKSIYGMGYKFEVN